MSKEQGRDLRQRTTAFALRIIHVVRALPRDWVAEVLGKQVLRSGTSVGAHYREASRAKSDADFISKLEGGLQELDETAYWLELLVADQVIPGERLQPLMQETHELTAIFVTMVKHTREKRRMKAEGGRRKAEG